MFDVELVVEAGIEEALQDLCASLDKERLDAMTMQEREELVQVVRGSETGDVWRVVPIGHLL